MQGKLKNRKEETQGKEIGKYQEKSQRREEICEKMKQQKKECI